MTTLDYILVVLLIFELFFAWDLYKKFNNTRIMLAEFVKVAEERGLMLLENEVALQNKDAMLQEKESSLAHLQAFYERKLVECNYLRGLLDDQGIEWERGWRKLQ